MRLALCQMNATVGDISGNARAIRHGIQAAQEARADLVLFPELALTGYPPEDLLLRESFLADARTALEEIALDVGDLSAVVGFPERAAEVHNSAAILARGRIHAIYRKVHLPNYGVFDERRYFQPGPGPAVLAIGEPTLGLTVCEDIWEPGPPASLEAHAGATLILNISASPYHAGKGREREEMLAQRARESVAFIAFCALVGGQDELVFDGRSCVIDHTGRTIARSPQFEEDLLLCDLDLGQASAARLRQARHRPGADADAGPVRRLPPLPAPEHGFDRAPRGLAPGGRAAEGRARPEPVTASLADPIPSLEGEVYAALLLGLSDYVRKNSFHGIVLGVSGGIDSALVACLAVDALGPEQVHVAIMPSPYSSQETQADARRLAAGLAVHVHEIPIEPIMDAYDQALFEAFRGRDSDIAEENLQARTRGNLLMALSNKFGWLVLATGNKSEMSVGYSTLYGDLAGGLALIKDVPKTLVYSLVRWRNSPAAGQIGLSGQPIPGSIIDRAPSAELRHEQRDEDSLPPYPVLDRIIQGYVELDRSRERLISEGLPAEEVERTITLIDRAEYKRRQAPPGIKVTARAFGRDRRMPITNRYRD